VAVFALLVAAALVVMKIVPGIPGHFTFYEWIALGIWILLGLAAATTRRAASETGKGTTSVVP
jgi:ABC-type transport system involved in cytochrome c biogenesis permease subunit